MDFATQIESIHVATSTPWLIATIALMAICVVMMFMPRTPACIVGYMALWTARFSGYTPFTTSTMIFWGVVVIIVAANRFLLPAQIRLSRRGIGYIAGGAIAGMAVGLTLYRPATVITGAVLGAFLAAIAYTRTERGKVLQFPTAKFFNYLGAKGLPAVMAASMVGLILAALIKRHLLIASFGV